jgi:hypothetical protein
MSTQEEGSRGEIGKADRVVYSTGRTGTLFTEQHQE